MDHPLFPGRWADAIRREWRLRHLSDPRYAFLFDPAPADEWVSLACASTGHDIEHDQLLSLCAVRVAGQRVLASERLELLLRPSGPVPASALRAHRLREQDLIQHGTEPAQAMERLLHFIGSRPLLGYYLEFDVALLDRLLRPLIGIGLPQPMIELSTLYHDWQFNQLPPYQQEGVQIDLRYASMLAALELPRQDSADPVERSVATALAFLKLRQLQGD
jgi:DNA polymerase-3 subunit epsilon